MLRDGLIQAIRNTLEHLKCPVPNIDDRTIPANIAGFDSQVWTHAMNVLRDLLPISLPKKVNVFKSGGKPNRSLTVTEVVNRLAEYLVSTERKVA